MSGGFIYRHQELRQTQLDVPAIENTLNDYWTCDRKVLLSEENTRFQILWIKLLKGCKWVNGRPTKVQKTTRPETIWPEEWHRPSKKQKQEDNAAWDEEETRLQGAAPKTMDLRHFFRQNFRKNVWFLHSRVFPERNARGNPTQCRYSKERET